MDLITTNWFIRQFLQKRWCHLELLTYTVADTFIFQSSYGIYRHLKQEFKHKKNFWLCYWLYVWQIAAIWAHSGPWFFNHIYHTLINFSFIKTRRWQPKLSAQGFKTGILKSDEGINVLEEAIPPIRQSNSDFPLICHFSVSAIHSYIVQLCPLQFSSEREKWKRHLLVSL